MGNPAIIIFDGECNLCNVSVDFIIKHDPQGHFVFAPFQSRIAKDLLPQYSIQEFTSDSIVLIKDKKHYQRADALFEIMKDLNGFWSYLRLFRFLPSSLNDILYRAIAKNRYRIFGRASVCRRPSEDIASRFLDDTV